MKCRCTETKVMIFSLSIAGIFLFILTSHSFSKTTNNQETEHLVKGLLSADPSEREQAKIQFLQIGPKAVGSLLSLLEKATSPTVTVSRNQNGIDPKEKMMGKIVIGEAQWYVEIEAARNHSEELSIADATRRLDNLKSQVRQDVIEICQQLGVEDNAIQLLVNCLYDSDLYDTSTDGSFSMPTGMQVLVELGDKAVPEVLEIFQRAESQLQAKMSGADTVSSEITERRVKRNAIKARARAAIVLGEIGSKEGLPHLEDFLKTFPIEERLNRQAAYYIEEAIKKIKQRNHLK
jgi:HEAT repeat protein